MRQHATFCYTRVIKPCFCLQKAAVSNRSKKWRIKCDQAEGLLNIEVVIIILYSLLFQFAKMRQSLSLHAEFYGRTVGRVVYQPFHYI